MVIVGISGALRDGVVGKSMAYIVEQHKLAYFPIPKVACSSIKTLMYFIKTGEELLEHRDTDGSVMHIHRKIATQKFQFTNVEGAENCFRFAVVRDPIERFISCYINRVTWHRDLSEEVIKLPLAQELGLKTDPNINEFVDNLEAYRLISYGVAHHTDPQTYFLGSDLDYFHRIYKINELPQLVEDLRERTSQDLRLLKLQPSHVSLPPAELTPRSIRKLQEFYSGDYALFHGISF